jgi:hypothetical protein
VHKTLGSPDETVLNVIPKVRERLYACCNVFEGREDGVNAALFGQIVPNSEVVTIVRVINSRNKTDKPLPRAAHRCSRFPALVLQNNGAQRREDFELETSVTDRCHRRCCVQREPRELLTVNSRQNRNPVRHMAGRLVLLSLAACFRSIAELDPFLLPQPQ